MRIVVAFLLFLSSLPAFASDAVVVKKFPGCQTRTVMDRVMELIDQKDYMAADKIFETGFRTGDCQVFEIGQSVVLESREIFSGLSKIHLKGAPASFWVHNSTIR